MKLRKNQAVNTPHGPGHIVQFTVCPNFQSGCRVKGKDFDVNVPRFVVEAWIREQENEQA